MQSCTIVFYSTDNGPHMNSWPDAAMTPFRNEKNSNWEGAYRVPAMIRWPGHIKPGAVSNEIMSHLDWMPTLLAIAGEPDITEKLKTGYTAGARTFKVHLDGYNFLPYLTNHEQKGPREAFFYFSDDGDLTGLRYDNWRNCLRPTTSARHHVGLGRAVCENPDSMALQLAHRSLRAGEHHIKHLLGLVFRPYIPVGTSAGVCR